MGLKFFESEVRLIPGVHVPVRSTLVPCDKDLILIAPIDFSPAQLAEIRAQGQVTVIVAPNLYHNLFVQKALMNFPNAILWGAPGFEKKCPDLPWRHFFGKDEWPYKAEVEYVCVEGAPSIQEVVFFHRGSESLITTDLFFNIQQPRGWLTPLTFRLLDIYKKFAMSKLWNRAIKDREATEGSLRKIFEWKFKKIVMAHGQPIEKDAYDAFRTAIKKRNFSV